MQVERVRPAVLQVHIHATELATLVAAARWALETSPGVFPEQARTQLRQVLASYDHEVARLAG